MAWNIGVPTAQYYDHESPGLEALIREIEDTKVVAIDTETTGLIVWHCTPLYFSLAWGQKRATLSASALPYFTHIFEDPDRDWILANAKFDAHMLANVGITIAGRLVDVQVAHALLFEERSHSLKDICEHLLGWRWSDFQDTFGKIGKKQSAEEMLRRAEKENFQLLVEYAANDAWGTLCSYNELITMLKDAYTYSLFSDKHPYITTLYDLFDRIEVPYTKVLWTCERNGIRVDLEYLQKISPTAVQEIAELEKQICKEAGRILNPNSTPQLSDYFFNTLGLAPVKMTKGGKSGIRKPSCDEKTLERFAENGVKMAQLVLKHRELSKLHGTYIEGLNRHADPFSRIHPRFNQDVARTGRLSSSDPNCQNIPKPDNDKWKLRGAFVPAPGNELIVADYEQLEMRLLAAGSLEPGMIEVITRGWDIHMGNAAMIFGIPYEEIQQAKKTEKKVKNGELPPEAITARVQECLDARSAAKTLGFGIVYGMGEAKLANALGITREEAAAKLVQFRKAYPAVDRFATEAVEETEATGYAFTILGRRRNVPQILSPRKDERLQAERISVNTPIQGSAADVVKMAQLLCHAAGLEKRYGAKMCLQVHDELVFDCPKETAVEAMEEIKDWMEHPFIEELAVPLRVDINRGSSWMAAK